MLSSIRRALDSFKENRSLKSQIEQERQSPRLYEQQLLLHTLAEGGHPSQFDSAELRSLPFVFQTDELLAYVLYDVSYRVVLASVRREVPESAGFFVRRSDAEDTQEPPSPGSRFAGEGGYLAVTTKRVYFSGERGGGLRFHIEEVITINDESDRKLTITFDDDSPNPDRWLGVFVLDEPDSRFAKDLVQIMPKWSPKPMEQPSLGFGNRT